MADDLSPDDAVDEPEDSFDEQDAASEEPEPAPDGPTRAPVPLSKRLTRAVMGPAGPADPGRPLTDAELKRQVSVLDPTERKIGNFAALFAALLTVLFTYKGVGNPKSAVPSPTKPGAHHSCGTGFVYSVVNGKGTCLGVEYNKSYWVLLLVVGLAFAVAIYVATRSGRRAALGFAAVMTGLAYDTKIGIFGIPFLFFGGWLLLRAYRVQKYGTVNAKEAAQRSAEQRAAKRGGTAVPPGTSAKTGSGQAAASAAPRGRTKRGKADTTSPTGRTAPAPNKRYTPKTPQKKKVTPPPT